MDMQKRQKNSNFSLCIKNNFNFSSLKNNYNIIVSAWKTWEELEHTYSCFNFTQMYIWCTNGKLWMNFKSFQNALYYDKNLHTLIYATCNTKLYLSTVIYYLL